MTNKRVFTRQRIISTILAIALLYFAFSWMKKLASSKKQPEQRIENKLTNVIYSPIKLVDTSVEIKSNGVLRAKNKIEVVSRVQGIFEGSARAFRTGVAFSKGDVLVSIDNDELYANLRAAKAQLLQNLTAILADLKFDYPDAYDKWNAYVSEFSVDGLIVDLPETASDRERAFINSQNIITQFYNIKAQEVRNRYHKIRAPFNGVLTEALVNKGALVSVGQKLGSFINTSVFELDLRINPKELEMIKVGKTVTLKNNDGTKSWQAKITRINKLIDTQSQSAIAIAEVSGRDLREGMYMLAEISTVDLKDVVEIPRSLLVDERFIYVVKDSTLNKVELELVHSSDKSVYAKGVDDGSLVVQKAVSGAYDGMKVNPINIIQ